LRAPAATVKPGAAPKLEKDSGKESEMFSVTLQQLPAGWLDSFSPRALVRALADRVASRNEFDELKNILAGLLSGGSYSLTREHCEIASDALARRVSAAHNAHTAEFLLRRTELRVFTATLRSDELLPSLDDSQAAEEARRGLDRCMAVHKSLAHYREFLAVDAAATSRPFVRRLSFQYPDDSAVFGLRHQFLLGPDFLIAPVLDRSATKVRVYLPEGKWTHVWTGREFLFPVGQWTDVAAPLGQPGVFYRSGARSGDLFVLSLMEASVI
jgi:sulfoquinovosidase